ncbi:IS5 family transposase [Sphingomonas psychrolutea]|uniref:IS5 family transposase n=1 Tax=Sphingomonas psychrolutea TaxID=1259676 RepID=A0ABQ1H8N1_9SPHN|nr:IS5 family transposase [Sphingomonas psychrolutea]
MGVMPKPAAPVYRTTNWPEYNAALKRRGSLEIWFDPEMHWLSKPCGRPGRPMRFSDGAIELCRRQKTLKVNLGGRANPGGLHLLVDSTGIKMTGEGEWKTRKHGASYRRQWRKVHLGIDAGTLDIRAIEVTTNAIGDAPTLPDFLAQIPGDEQILSVGGDGAYDTRACYAAIAKHGADAVIPVRRNGRPWTKDGPGVDARNEALRVTKRLGRAIWKKWSGYHRRSLVETKMHCFKLLGQRVMNRPGFPRGYLV